MPIGNNWNEVPLKGTESHDPPLWARTSDGLTPEQLLETYKSESRRAVGCVMWMVVFAGAGTMAVWLANNPEFVQQITSFVRR